MICGGQDTQTVLRWQRMAEVASVGLCSADDKLHVDCSDTVEIPLLAHGLSVSMHVYPY